MTPLHILTCSTVHNLELYRLVIDNYPKNLSTEDRWEALPLLYVFWGAAPAEIIQFLFKSYQSLYPGYAFNWTMMVETMWRSDTTNESIENLLRAKQMKFPEQPIDWDYLLHKFANSPYPSLESIFTQRMQFLVMFSLAERVEALAFTVWRDYISNMIQTGEFKYNYWVNFHTIQRIREKVAHFEDEYIKQKELMTLLELALWKMRMNENISQEEATRCWKIVKTDESSMRRQFRITCGADVVIRHVFTYLIPVTVQESDSNSDSDDDSNNSMSS
jgi:hypothetical protein